MIAKIKICLEFSKSNKEKFAKNLFATFRKTLFNQVICLGLVFGSILNSNEVNMIIYSLTYFFGMVLAFLREIDKI